MVEITKEKKQKTYVCIILDKSSSMGSIKTDTISHYNEQIEQIAKESADMDTLVSLITFNQNVSVEFFNEPVDRFTPLTLRNYQPNGMTAMYDAVGTGIDRLIKMDDIHNDNVAVLMVVVSDGCENASKQYTQKSIANRINELQSTERWTFTYLGANQDLSQITDSLNIPAGNVTAFVADSAGMERATSVAVNSSQQYFQSRRLGQTQVKNYYSEKKS